MQTSGREPSMEDILASIKKVIAEEKELRTATEPVDSVEDEPLPEDATPHVSLVEWLRSDPDELRRRFARLYVPRNDGRRLRLNALVAAGNVGGDGERDAVSAHLDDLDEKTRELAAWALARLEERDA